MREETFDKLCFEVRDAIFSIRDSLKCIEIAVREEKERKLQESELMRKQSFRKLDLEG